MAYSKRGLATLIGSGIAVLVAYAATYPRFHSNDNLTGAANLPLASGTSIGFDTDVPLAATRDPLAWARLTPTQRIALAPFATEWNNFSTTRKRKWLHIAVRFQKMSPDAQARLQARMREWVEMTPEQRRLARENYQAAQDLSSQLKANAWSAYQQLPEALKEKLATLEKHRHPTVVSAPPSGKTDRAITRLVDAHGASATVPELPAEPPAASQASPASTPASSAIPPAPASSTTANPVYYGS